jgi:hypothetical protein
MKKFMVFGMTVLILSLGLIGCADPDDSSSSANWDGEYQVKYTTNITKLDLKAKTITGLYKNNEWDGSAVISNVSVGDAADFPSLSGTINHSGKWAYVYSDSKKIGVIYTWTMSTGGSYNETEISLLIGSNEKNDIRLWVPSDGSRPNEKIDLSDVEIIDNYSINASREEK